MSLGHSRIFAIYVVTLYNDEKVLILGAGVATVEKHFIVSKHGFGFHIYENSYMSYNNT